MKKCYLLILIQFIVFTKFSSAQIPVDSATATVFQNKIDSFLTEYSIPGISVSLLLPGNHIWNGAAGLSNIYTMVPMDTNHLFEMASCGKMYTSAMIFQLYEQGLLSINDTIGMYLPPMTNVPGDITIANLLQHRTGIADVTLYPGLFNEFVSHPDSIWPHMQTIQTCVDSIRFPQGQFFEYSNSNYILLGMIIEQITGNTFAQEFHNRFCTPFGLTQTFFAPDDSIAGPETPGWTSFSQVGVYDTDASLILNDCSASIFFTAGAVIAKPADVSRFIQKLWTGQIVSDSLLNLMQQCTPVNFGGGCDGYGYGAMRYKFHGKTYYGHGGDVNGFTQLSLYHQGDSVALTLSINRNNAPRGPMADEIFALINQTILAVEEYVNAESVSVFPNPAQDVINIKFNSERNQIIETLIYDQYGKEVHHSTRGNNNSIDVSEFATGLYHFKIVAENGVFTKSFIVSHGGK